MKQVGILGGGQLGKMLAASIYKLGGSASIYDPDANAPARYLANRFFNNSWTDDSALEQFFSFNDVITYEFENVESSGLIKLERLKPIFPSLAVLQTTQDRVKEKLFLQHNGLPHARFIQVNGLSDLGAQVSELGFPCILKSARGGYDGKGQFFLADQDSVKTTLSKLDAHKASFYGVLEEALDLHVEVSCIVARNETRAFVFPVFENQHKNHILDFTLTPARIPIAVQETVKRVALEAAEALNVRGLLTTEFFLGKAAPRHSNYIQVDEWYVYVNEFAPRPHNSGHVTANACTYSQFDALARILLDIPLQEPRPAGPGTYCMGNLLGEVWLDQKSTNACINLSSWTDYPSVLDVTIYGKHEPRVGRKMGHFVTHDNTATGALSCAEKFREELSANKRR